MTSDDTNRSFKQDLEETAEDLKQIADEIRVKLHLAGMDAKDAWDDLQPKLRDFEQRFDATAGEVGDELKALGGEIRQRLLNIKNKIASD